MCREATQEGSRPVGKGLDGSNGLFLPFTQLPGIETEQISYGTSTNLQNLNRIGRRVQAVVITAAR